MKISLMKGVLRFGTKGKLNHRYIGPYEILEQVGNVAYGLKLPQDLASSCPMVHVSMLKNCLGDQASILPVEGLGFDENLSYEEVRVEILHPQVKRFRNKEVSTVKILWRSHFVEGAMWEANADMRSRFSYIFISKG